MRPALTGFCTAALLMFGIGAASANPSLVVDVATGQVLHQEEATRPWIPASTTKMMTAYVALKAIRDGKARLDSPLQVSALAARQRPVKLHLRPGQIVTLDNALKIMMVKSANDIAYVVAEGIGGTVPEFAAMMNAEAQRLGMQESHFVNPNGWDAPGQQTSARDLAILARALLRDFPEYESYWGIGALALGPRVIRNTNGLIGRYPGIMGMKTGFLCASGFNVVAVADRGGRRLITVVLGASSAAERTVRAAQLFDEAGTGWGGGQGTLNALPPSGLEAAPNICADIRRRGTTLADDVESDAPIVANQASGNQDERGNQAYAMLLAQAQPKGNVASRAPTGRIVLGPRAESDPLPVYIGRAPGNTAPILAGINRSPAPGLPASAMALAAAPKTSPLGGIPLSSSAGPVTANTSSGGIGRFFPGGKAAPAVSQDATDPVGAPLQLTTAPLPAAKEKPGAVPQPTSAKGKTLPQAKTSIAARPDPAKLKLASPKLPAPPAKAAAKLPEKAAPGKKTAQAAAPAKAAAKLPSKLPAKAPSQSSAKAPATASE